MGTKNSKPSKPKKPVRKRRTETKRTGAGHSKPSTNNHHAPPVEEDTDNPFSIAEQIQEEEQGLLTLQKCTHFELPTLRKLNEIFTAISGSVLDDGMIDVEELTIAMGLKDSQLIAQMLFRLFDISRTKQVNLRTWVMTLSALCPKATREERARWSFDLYDINRDGSVDDTELKALLIAALKDMNIELTDAQVSEILHATLDQVDVDGNGAIDFDEFKKMVYQHPQFLDNLTLDVERLVHNWDSLSSFNLIDLRAAGINPHSLSQPRSPSSSSSSSSSSTSMSGPACSSSSSGSLGESSASSASDQKNSPTSNKSGGSSSSSTSTSSSSTSNSNSSGSKNSASPKSSLSKHLLVRMMSDEESRRRGKNLREMAHEGNERHKSGCLNAVDRDVKPLDSDKLDTEI